MASKPGNSATMEQAETPSLILWSLWHPSIQEEDDITVEAADISLSVPLYKQTFVETIISWQNFNFSVLPSSKHVPH